VLDGRSGQGRNVPLRLAPNAVPEFGVGRAEDLPRYSVRGQALINLTFNVSIHAPTKGVTRKINVFKRVADVSTHAPQQELGF